MAEFSSKPSFSRARKWGIGLNVLLATILVFAVATMLNYLSGRYFRRFYLSSVTRIELSPRTLHVLYTLTNDVHVTLYYDREEALYGDISDLLKEYHNINPKIVLDTVDYDRDPGAAQDVKSRYNLGSATNKDLVIFDCAGSLPKIIPGATLAEYTLEPVPNATEREFRRKPVAFKGEMAFTGALLAVTSTKPLKAYFLQGHGERGIDDPSDVGFQKLATILRDNHIEVEPVSLITNAVPSDCSLLVVAAPDHSIPDLELGRIAQYLNDGGRLFVLVNAISIGHDDGLAKILEPWGIGITTNIVKDPDYTTTAGDSDVLIHDYGTCPAVNPLVGSQLQLIWPREIKKIDPPTQGAEGLKVEETAFTGPRSFVRGHESKPEHRKMPVMVAMEKGAVKGVVTERGMTRAFVVGDSIFLGNRLIDSGANRDFAGYAANWLLDRTVLLEGLGPKPMNEYRIALARTRLQTLEWILMGAMPGGVLAIGGVVWLLRRR